MLISKKTALRPLLESADGVHLTIYLENSGKLEELKVQLKESLDVASECLEQVMSIEEQEKFFAPVQSLFEDNRIFSQIRGNIGVFRNCDSFRVLNIPVHVESACHVATSFHIKPLLRWMQMDQDFLLLGLGVDSANLYSGNQDTIKLVDSISFPKGFGKRIVTVDEFTVKSAFPNGVRTDRTIVWLNEWIGQLTKQNAPKLFIAGDPSILSKLCKGLKYRNFVKTPVAEQFNKDAFTQICENIRAYLKMDSKAIIENALMEFRFAAEGSLVRKNIFQIAKAVVQGRVRKLIVSDELSIFGKIDRSSGGLSIHPFDMDHEDDDLLDDLAQMVLSRGGEVVVASRSEIPKGRPILAILEDEKSSGEKSDDFINLSLIQKRLEK